MVKFENFSQSVEPVGNRFNRFCLVASVLKTHRIVSVGSHSSWLRIERRFFLLDSLLFEKFSDRVLEFFSIN